MRDVAPAATLPAPENLSTPEKEILGKILFWEEQMGSDDKMACGTCHRGEKHPEGPRRGADDGVF